MALDVAGILENVPYRPQDRMGVAQYERLQAAATVGLIRMSAIDFFLWRLSEKHNSMESTRDNIHMQALLTQIFANNGGRYKDEILHTVHKAGKEIRDGRHVTPMKRSASHLDGGAQDYGESSRSRPGPSFTPGFVRSDIPTWRRQG